MILLKLFLNHTERNTLSESYVEYEIFNIELFNNKRQLINILKESKGDNLYVLTYRSLQTTMSTFTKLISLLENFDCTLSFLNESDQFVTHLQAIYETEITVQKNKLSEGLRNARLQGIYGGRPKIPDELKSEIIELYLEKKSYREISALCGASLGTISKYVGELKKENKYNQLM